MAQRESQNGNQTSPSFESALEELQQIVRELEDGTLGLEDSMRRFEKGIGLLRSCYQTLEQAEQKIQILTGLDAAGNPAFAQFDATATIEQGKAPAGKRGTRQTPAKPKPEIEENDFDDHVGSTLF